MTTCREIMTPNPKCHEQNAMANLVAKTMKDSNIGPVPIVDANSSMHLVGIVTDRDLALKIVAADRDPRLTPIKEIMSSYPVACQPDMDIEEALQLMEECQIRRIPVVDQEQCLVGIITQADIATRLHDRAKTAEVVEEISKENPSEISRH